MPKLYNDVTKELEEWPWEPELGKVYGELAGIKYPDTDKEFHAWAKAMHDFPKSQAAKICDKAATLIDGERDKQHGDRNENFGCIASLWSAYLDREIKPHQVAWMMVMVKLARETNGTHSIDNAIDACGYAALAGELADQDNGC